jgi:hypothetical protein
MKEWTVEDMHKVHEFTTDWDHLSDNKRQVIAATIAGNSRDIEDVLRFISWIKHFERNAWPGFPEGQKHEIATRFPQVADDIESIETATRIYVEGAEEDGSRKREDKIVGLCLQLSDELEACKELAFGQFDELREALGRIKAKSGEHRRQPKDNARQDARNVFMEQLLDIWLWRGGKTGGERSPMVTFFQTAWPKQRIRNLPTPSAIAQWAYAREQKPDRVMLELIRRVLALEADSPEQREAALKRLEKFEARHPEAVAKLRNGLRR